MPSRKTAFWSRLIAAAAGTEALYFFLPNGLSGDLAIEAALHYFSLWTGLLILYALALRATRNRSGRVLTLFIFATSLLFRATVVYSSIESPTLHSSWLNSYLTASLEPEAAILSEKALALGADMAALAIAPSLLKAAGLPACGTLIYGWNPLAVRECASGSGLVQVGVLLFAVALGALHKNARLWAAISYGASYISGWGPATCLPLLARQLGGYTVASIALAAGALAPAILERTFDIELAGTPSVGASLSAVAVSVANVFFTRRVLYPLALCWGAWLFTISYRALRKRPQASQLPVEALLAWGGFLMVSPQALPWHFVPIAYLAAFSPNRGWLVFTATAPITYLAFVDGEWSGWSFWLGFLQYFAAYFALVFGWLGRFRDRQTGGSTA